MDEASAELIGAVAKHANIDVEVGKTPEVLARSHFALTASGTVTLSVAHFGTPMVIFYRVNRLGWNLLGRWLLRTKQISLVNILAGRKIVPELIPWFGKAKPLTDSVMEAMGDYGWMASMQKKLPELVAPLSIPAPNSAADNTAKIVTTMLGEK